MALSDHVSNLGVNSHISQMDLNAWKFLAVFFVFVVNWLRSAFTIEDSQNLSRSVWRTGLLKDEAQWNQNKSYIWVR